MTRATPIMGRKTIIWLLVAAGLVALVGANVHLVYVAASSQPDCIPHARIGDATAGAGQFSAARSSCSSR
jgi:hypothetical protein